MQDTNYNTALFHLKYPNIRVKRNSYETQLIKAILSAMKAGQKRCYYLVILSFKAAFRNIHVYIILLHVYPSIKVVISITIFTLKSIKSNNLSSAEFLSLLKRSSFY